MEHKNIEQEIAALEERVRALKGATGSKSSSGNFFLVFSVLLGAAIIGGAVLYRGSGTGENALLPKGGTAAVESAQTGIRYMKPVTASDHVRGDLAARVILVEFSDTECPFCKQFHETMRDIVESYGGKVAWVYRHFPIDGLHPKARKEAEAFECAAELGGNEKFWKYADRLFEITPSNNGLAFAELANIAEYVGLNRSEFQACLESGRHAARVQQDREDAEKSGGRGTPYTVVVKDGVPVDVIEGALPYYSVKLSIEEAMR